MKAVIYRQTGGPDVLEWADVPDPHPAPGRMVVAVHATALEGGDLVRRASSPPDPQGTILGYAAAGIVQALGAEVSGFRVGDRVVTVVMNGGHAELVACDPATTWAIPDALSFERAAVLPISFGTAHECLFAAGGLAVGEIVLIQGGAGGLGIALLQLAKLAGATVLATVTGEERQAALRARGLDHAIDHTKDDVAAAVSSITGSALCDLVVDPIGGKTLASSIASLRPHGRLVFVGNAGGVSLEVDLWPALQSNLRLRGVYMGTEFARPDVRAAMDELIHQAAAGTIDPVVAETFPLRDAASAHRLAETAQRLGRVVLTT